jgi:hypothetical protein
MKLGISYGAFDGVELLEYTIRNMRKEVDFICLVRQEMSYHGNPADPQDLETVDWLLKVGLADEVVNFTPDLKLHPQTNETNIRNLGLDRAIANGCTHHTSADVDEFYIVDQLRTAKESIGDADWSVAESLDYYRRPVWKIVPERRHLISFIHPVHIRYAINLDFPQPVDITRRPEKFESCLVYPAGTFEIHHMNYVRNDVKKKMLNNLNHTRIPGTPYRFAAHHDKYQVGDPLNIPPDKKRRKTIEVPNLFNIEESNGRIISHRS